MEMIVPDEVFVVSGDGELAYVGCKIASEWDIIGAAVLDDLRARTREEAVAVLDDIRAELIRADEVFQRTGKLRNWP